MTKGADFRELLANILKEHGTVPSIAHIAAVARTHQLSKAGIWARGLRDGKNSQLARICGRLPGG